MALDDGWLNLGLWEGDGSDPAEAPVAVRRLVREVAAPLPAGGAVLDVGNGLAVQDVEIAGVALPSRLTALNITLSQLRAGSASLAAAGGHGVNGDACRMPFAARSFDGVISVEAAFHFPSRRTFFDEAFRVLRPGGVLTFSDVPVTRMPSDAREALAGVAMLRLWGIHRRAAATPSEITGALASAGFADVRSRLVGDRVIGARVPTRVAAAPGGGGRRPGAVRCPDDAPPGAAALGSRDPGVPIGQRAEAPSLTSRYRPNTRRNEGNGTSPSDSTRSWKSCSENVEPSRSASDVRARWISNIPVM